MALVAMFLCSDQDRRGRRVENVRCVGVSSGRESRYRVALRFRDLFTGGLIMKEYSLFESTVYSCTWGVVVVGVVG